MAAYSEYYITQSLSLKTPGDGHWVAVVKTADDAPESEAQSSL